jgi:hypothetical protein
MQSKWITDHVLQTRYPRYRIVMPGESLYSLCHVWSRIVDGKWGAGVFAIVWKISMGGNSTRLSFGMNYCVEIDETVRFCCKFSCVWNLQVGCLLLGTMSVLCVCTVRQCVHDAGTRLNHNPVKELVSTTWPEFGSSPALIGALQTGYQKLGFATLPKKRSGGEHWQSDRTTVTIQPFVTIPFGQ